MSGPARINLPALRQRTWPTPPRSRRGEQRLGQPMLPFQSGTGMLGVESRTPVVPVHIVRERVRGILPGSWRARVSVRFGAPAAPTAPFNRRAVASRRRRAYGPGGT